MFRGACSRSCRTGEGRKCRAEKVDPAVAGIFEKVVFLCEFVRYVAEFDSDVLWAVERGEEVEVAYVGGG